MVMLWYGVSMVVDEKRNNNKKIFKFIAKDSKAKQREEVKVNRFLFSSSTCRLNYRIICNSYRRRLVQQLNLYKD